MSSRGISPIHGFVGDEPVRASRLLATSSLDRVEEQLSPIEHPPTTGVRRQPAVTGQRPDVESRRLVPSSSSDEGRRPPSRSSSVGSYLWDHDPSTLNLSDSGRDNPTDPNKWTTSTQFGVSLDKIENIETSDEEDIFTEAREKATPSTSIETVKAMDAANENPAGLDNQVPRVDNGADQSDDSEPEVLEATLDLYAVKIGGNAVAKKAFKVIKKVVVAWEDDFKSLNPSRMVKERLDTKLEKAEELKEQLAEAALDLDEHDPEGWTEDVEQAVRQLKRNFVSFIEKADHQLHVIHNTSAADPVAQVKANRVRKRGPTLVAEMKNIENVLAAASSVDPEDEPSYLVHHENATTNRERARSLADDAKALIKDATEAALPDEAEYLENALQALQVADRELVSKLVERKSTFGIVTNASAAQRTDMPLPKFTGNVSDCDYYTFLSDWNQYTASRVMSESEKFRTLTRSCLTGQARNICKRFSTINEVLEHLKKAYGNPLLLFNAKVEELRKLGACAGADLKRREWLVDVKARMDDLEKLCAEHNLSEKLYNCAIAGEIQNNLSNQALKEFKAIVKREDPQGNVSAMFFWTSLSKHLDTCIDNITFDINFELNSGHGRKNNSNSTSGNGNRNREGKFGQKVYFTEDPEPQERPKKNKQKARKNKKTSSSKKEKNEIAAVHVNIPATYKEPVPVACPLCPGVQHTYGFYCSHFQRARGKDRIACGAKMKLCFRCLRSDSCIDVDNKDTWWASHEKNCVTTWTCALGNCPRNGVRREYHILMCMYHVQENKERERAFVQELDQQLIVPGVGFFLNYSLYQLDSQPAQPPSSDPNVLDDIVDPSIFLLQYIERKGQVFLLFFDSGCGGAAISHRAAEALDSVCIRPGPTTLNVAGAMTMEIEGGDESFQLKLADSEVKATFTGLKMPEITSPFPTWNVKGAWPEIMSDLRKCFPDHDDIPQPPDVLGGVVVDVMIGVRYSKYYPKLLYMLPSGLGIYKSQLEAYGGNSCVLGGSHPSWRRFKDIISFSSPFSFFSSEMRAYNYSCITVGHTFSPGKVKREERVEELLDCEDENEIEGQEVVPVPELAHPGLDAWELCDISEENPKTDSDVIAEDCRFQHCQIHRENEDRWIIPSDWNLESTIYSLREDTQRFLGGELIGSEIAYRCVKCRCCADCRKSAVLEAKSLKEEVEQAMIDDSVTYYPLEKRLVGKLPFIESPSTNLLPNRFTAEKIFQSQLKKISASEDMKTDVLLSFEKLACRGYLAPVSSFDEATQKLIMDESDAGHYIPWRTVFKQNSLSTPCRIVFDASSKTPGGSSLNDLLAKGENRLSTIHHILLKFRYGASAFAADIRLAYNQIGLAPEHMRYQKFLWKKDLDPSAPTEVYVISTLIYGVKPAGNCLLAGFSKLSQYCVENYPEHAAGAEALNNAAYVDDIAKSSPSAEISRKTAESLDFVLSQASMEVKGYTFSGFPPPPDVSSDGKTIGIVGLVWASVADTLTLDIKPLYFGKVSRGKYPEPVTGDIEESLRKNFTRRNMLGKVAGVFDPIGLVTPITSRLKLDLHVLSDLKLGWDEKIPDEYLSIWLKNLRDIQSLKSVQFERSIVPLDAPDDSVELIVSSDASKSVAVACVHARVRKSDGSYSCSLVTAKSKLVRELTIPKAELRAAVLAVHVGHNVKFTLGKQHKHTTYVTDSSIALHWISSDSRPLETAVRNCCIEIRRFCSPSQWYHVESALNIADLGTREAAIEDILPGSAWQTGFEWMKGERENMPILSVEDVNLSQEEKRVAGQEVKKDDISFVHPFQAEKVSDRYRESKYLVDPCKYGWSRATRVMGLVLRFVRCFKRPFCPVWKPSVDKEGPALKLWNEKPVLTSADIEYGERYFFYKATLEVKENVPSKDRQDMDEKNGILYYIGRILDGQEVPTPVDTMFDVSPLHFVRPVVDRFSPIAYAIMLYVHEKVVFHRSAATTLRESRSIAFILRGRDLANEIKQACRPCKRFRAKLVESELGKLDDSRITIAPPFYIVQVDLFGPILARCQHNHRSTVKVWGVVFRDPACAAISVHAMSGYSTDHFLMAYTRFSSHYGHPFKLQIDSGTQLVSACRSMELSIVDITAELSTKYNVGVNYDVCPVGGHNVNGAVERSIRSVQDLFKRVFEGLKLDVLALETAFCWMASQINNLPVCLGNRTDNLDNLDVLTPSRLLLGRSSTRAAGGHARITPPSMLVEQMDRVYEVWWRLWEREKLSDYVPRPDKWRNSDPQLKKGDVIIIMKGSDEAKLGEPVWRLARVADTETSHRDGQVRVVTCEYKNPGESTFRTTRRSARKVAVVYTEAELDMTQELNRAAHAADISFYAEKKLETLQKLETFEKLETPEKPETIQRSQTCQKLDEVAKEQV